MAETTETRPVAPEWRTMQRARVIYSYEEQGQQTNGVESAWAYIDGPWLHWLPDSSLHWTSMPYTAIVSVEWELNAREATDA